jgi:hypothetical protein
VIKQKEEPTMINPDDEPLSFQTYVDDKNVITDKFWDDFKFWDDPHRVLACVVAHDLDPSEKSLLQQFRAEICDNPIALKRIITEWFQHARLHPRPGINISYWGVS